MMCKTPLTRMIYTADPKKSYASFDSSKLELDEKTVKQQKQTKNNASFCLLLIQGGYTCERAARDTLNRLFDCQCPICGPSVKFRDKADIKTHVSRVHDLHYCSVCLKDRPVFMEDQITFTRNELNVHMEKGDSKTHMKGHPRW
jgi:hypothetical protein